MKMLLLALLLAGHVSNVVATDSDPPDISQVILEQDQTGSGCDIACAALTTLFGPEQVLSQTEQAEYDAFREGYWSQIQADVRPHCIFKPETAREIGVQLQISRHTDCPFAVKSGGHSAFAGAASSIGGITVSLEKFKRIDLDESAGTVDVGPGNIWLDVYTALQDHDLAVIGGRVASIGVGGLTLGGGISFLSNLYGWACDNVASYEAVLANGTFITASPTTNNDLFFALRGGGPNFAIITNFRLKTIPLPSGLIWGGTLLHPATQFPALLRAFTTLGTTGIQSDPRASQILSFAVANNTPLASTVLTYARPVPNTTLFAPYLAVPDALATTDLGPRTLSNLTLSLQASNPSGLRQSFWTATYRLTAEIAAESQRLFLAELALLPPTLRAAPAFLPALTLQSISAAQLRPMALNGGNPLGLRATDAPFLLLDLSVMWADAADDARILAACRAFLRKAGEFARSRGLEVDYLYMNYASQEQDVVGSYGVENGVRLRGVAARYDPQGVFGRLRPGYFGLEGAPVGRVEVG